MKVSQLIQASIKRNILAMVPVGWRGPRIEFMPARKWSDSGTLLGAHLLQPSEFEFFEAMQAAQTDGVCTLYIYL